MQQALHPLPLGRLLAVPTRGADVVEQIPQGLGLAGGRERLGQLVFDVEPLRIASEFLVQEIAGFAMSAIGDVDVGLGEHVGLVGLGIEVGEAGHGRLVGVVSIRHDGGRGRLGGRSMCRPTLVQ